MNGRITGNENVDILGIQVHPVVQILFSDNDADIQDDTAPTHTARSVRSRVEGEEDTFEHLPWPAQSTDLNIVKPLWSVLESTVRSRFPPPSNVKQLVDFLHQVKHSIPLDTIQNLCESIPIRISSALQSNGGPTTY
jgi:hypothetical protein